MFVLTDFCFFNRFQKKKVRTEQSTWARTEIIPVPALTRWRHNRLLLTPSRDFKIISKDLFFNMRRLYYLGGHQTRMKFHCLFGVNFREITRHVYADARRTIEITQA